MKKVLLLLVVFNFQFSILNFIHAGGMMSNTNQNAAFIRNPARDGAIGIDGVYSNPAGVALMPEGWHMSLNWQLAWQRRIVDTQNPVFVRDANNGGKDSKHYRSGRLCCKTCSYRGYGELTLIIIKILKEDTQ